MAAQIPVLMATDEAEARGDVLGTLDLIEQHLAQHPDPGFWRPDRVKRLIQLMLFGADLPRWATSRWILAQAAQHLDPRTRPRFLRALQVAIETRGVDSLAGVDDLDARTKVIDHDWVFRQLWLYELGALDHFVTRIAAPDLLAGADHLGDWRRAPMGGFRLLEESSRVLTLQDLATGEEVRALDIGSAALLEEGDCAIGRLVPIVEGAMFESAPLYVPEHVAQRVASQPSGWVATVAQACAATGDRPGGLSTTMSEFAMLTDVPRPCQAELAFEVTRRTEVVLTPDDLTAAGVALVQAALDDCLPDDLVDPRTWPVVAAWVLEPGVILEVAGVLGPEDARGLVRLAEHLAGPAASLCRRLARELAAAA